MELPVWGRMFPEIGGFTAADALTVATLALDYVPEEIIAYPRQGKYILLQPQKRSFGHGLHPI